MGLYEEQAEQFLEYQKRGGQNFDFWADSKDFSPWDRAGILKEVRRLEASGWRPTSPEDLIARLKGFLEEENTPESILEQGLNS